MNLDRLMDELEKCTTSQLVWVKDMIRQMLEEEE